MHGGCFYPYFLLQIAALAVLHTAGMQKQPRCDMHKVQLCSDFIQGVIQA